VPSEYEKEFAKVFIFKVSASAFNIYINYQQQKKGAKVFVTSLTNIEKALRVQ